MSDAQSSVNNVTISINDEVYQTLLDEAADNHMSIEELIVSRIVSYNELVQRADAVERKATKLIDDITKLVGKGRIRAND
jgi:predicted CopG family antitoxin